MWDCLQNGILCRGGIAYGDIIEDNNTNLGQMLLGNAVSKAVKLEQAGAKGSCFNGSGGSGIFT